MKSKFVSIVLMFSVFVILFSFTISSADELDLFIIDASGIDTETEYYFKTDNVALVSSVDIPADCQTCTPILENQSGDYYIMNLINYDMLNNIPVNLKYLLIDNNIIFRTSPDDIEKVSHLGWGLTRLTKPINITKSTTQPVHPVTTDYNQNIADMIAGITAVSCESTLLELTSFPTRYSYAPECRTAETMVKDKFEAMSLNASYHDFTYNSTAMRNVIGEKLGTVSPESVIIICGHLDCTSEPDNRYTNAPGAEDNGSGSAAVLEAAKIFEGYETDLTIRFVTFSGEEQGLVGSSVYAEDMVSSGEIIAGVINLDMIAYRGAYAFDMHIYSDPQSYWLGEMAAEAMSIYTTLDTITQYEAQPRYGSDHYSFATRGYPSIFFIDAWTNGDDWYPYYHTHEDTIGHLDMAQLAEASQTAAAVAAQLARVQFGPNYLAGDANGSGGVNGLDVVFLVSYFKGGIAPDPLLSGDANGDCSTNGLDVVYLINFFKGGSAPILGNCP